jgi:hypothetical protein
MKGALSGVIGSDELPDSTVASTKIQMVTPSTSATPQSPQLGRADCVEIQIFGWLLDQGQLRLPAPLVPGGARSVAPQRSAQSRSMMRPSDLTQRILLFK